MKLKDLLKYIDMWEIIRIYTQDSPDDECAWVGNICDMPWIYAESEIDSNMEYPIHLNIDEAKPEIVVSVITK